MGQEEIPIRDLLNLCLGSEDQERWRDFVRRTQPLIASVIINTIRRWQEPSPSLVDDLIQDTFLKLFANERKALRSIKNEYENTIFGYLKVVASNVVRDHFRQAENKVEEIELTDPVLPPSPDGLDRIEFARLKDNIQARLQSLSSSETYRRDETIFWMYYEQGYTAKEISFLPSVGLTVKGVESTLLRLTRLIREDATASSSGNTDP
jgi:RNA polymerase sigma-70 factor (ECF subfamily)